MASSISSSSAVHDIVREPLPSGLRLTAADRPGVAQPVPERDIPDQPWRAMSLVVLVLVILFTSLWEWKMRRLELVPGDSSGTYDAWAELRRQVDKRDVPVAIISDSRLLYDTDLDRMEQLTGVRPLQLGIAGGARYLSWRILLTTRTSRAWRSWEWPKPYFSIPCTPLRDRRRLWR
ncbi:hypothetical protein [Tunturiibacter gelidiferens]|uniref:hypothetical protein n=1 Tax=Tunturiibacter gelidiferens TaxID=3069689 RepID=UPI003D9AEADA